MQTLKVQLDNGDIIDMTRDNLAGELVKHYPAWAVKDISCRVSPAAKVVKINFAFL